MKLYDPDEIRRWHATFKRDGEVFEIRLLGDRKNILSGYFTDVETAIRQLEPFDRQQTFQVYFVANEVNPACSSRRQYNQFLQVSGSATSGNDIVRRMWLPIDIDVKRPSDISSTDEEKAYAHDKAGEVYRFMQENGFPAPVVCDSSSGYHLYYPIDLDVTDKTKEAIEAIYEVLSDRFTDGRVKIDAAVGDANRIMRLPGTWGRKGRDSAERPHRMAKILAAPAVEWRAGLAFLQPFIDKYRIVEEKPVQRVFNGTGEAFDIRAFMQQHGLTVSSETPYGNGGTKFVLEECPFDPSHKAPDSAIFVTAHGAIGFKCFHDSCSHHDWHELRQKLDPSAYERTQGTFQPQQGYRSLRPSVPQQAVTPETEELGKRWLSMEDIDDEDLDNLPRIHTGFKAIDALLGGGLFLGETSILSGINGSGKSSWLNTLILNAVNEGWKTALWTGELRSKRLKRWLMQTAAGKRYVLESRLAPGKYYTPKHISGRIARWMRGRFFLYNNNYPSNYFDILSAMEDVVREGCQLFILDNLFAMDLDGLDGDENARQKAFILAIVAFAKKHNVHIVLVAHPRKVVTFLRKEDILGSSALQNAVDDIFIIHRTGNDFSRRASDFFSPAVVSSLMSFGNVIEICKNREFGAIEQLVGVHYDTRSRRFSDSADDDVRYGWEEDTDQQTMGFAEPQENTQENIQDSREDALPFGEATGDCPF